MIVVRQKLCQVCFKQIEEFRNRKLCREKIVVRDCPLVLGDIRHCTPVLVSYHRRCSDFSCSHKTAQVILALDALSLGAPLTIVLSSFRALQKCAQLTSRAWHLAERAVNLLGQLPPSGCFPFTKSDILILKLHVVPAKAGVATWVTMIVSLQVQHLGFAEVKLLSKLLSTDRSHDVTEIINTGIDPMDSMSAMRSTAIGICHRISGLIFGTL
jgi:hypothetical protein